MSRLEPSRMYGLLAVTSLGFSAWRRSWAPLLFGLAMTCTSVVVTLALKVGFHRADPHGYLPASGGAYPSGHMIGVVVCLAGCVLMARRPVPWWLWTPVAVGAALMAGALLVATAHWPTDVASGALVALCIVVVFSTLSLRYRACRPRSSSTARPGSSSDTSSGERRKRSRRGTTTSAS
jgi:membrane-associated phospholipid phosphatase